MKINTKKLQYALENLQRIAGRKVTLPILSHVKMEASAGWLTLTASNLDEYQTERVECEGDLDCCCVPAGHLQWSIGGEGCKIAREDKRLLVAHQFDRSFLPIMDAEEFPAWPSDEVSKIGVACPDVAKSIRRVAWAAAVPNSGRYNIEAVHIQYLKDILRAESSDGKILARLDEKLIASPFECVVPISFATNLANALDRPESVLGVCEKYISVEHAAGKYACKQMDGMFPNCSSVIPNDATKIGIATKAELKSIFDRCAYFSASDTGGFTSCKLTFSKDGLAVDFTGSNSVSSGKVAGKFNPLTIAFNIELFRDVLANIEGDDFVVSATDSKGLGPLVIQDGNLMIVAMPVRMS